MTTDIDVVVRGDSTSASALLPFLAEHDLGPRIDDAEAFAAETLVLLLQHYPTGVDVDLSFAWTEFEQHAIESSNSTRFGSLRVPIVRAQELVVFKALAGRARDVEDVTALLLMHRDIDESSARDRVAVWRVYPGRP